MKQKIFTLFFTLFISLTMFAQEKYERTYINFFETIDSIHVTIPSKIIINENIDSNQTTLRIYTPDKFTYDNILFTIENNILYIKPKKNCNLIELEPQNIKIRIITPNNIPIGTTKGFTINHSNLGNGSGKSTI